MANPIDRLIHAFGKLPGIGHKSATRLAFHVLRSPSGIARELAEALLAVQTGMTCCRHCLVPAPQDPCVLCADPQRDAARICVVEEPADVSAIEQTHVFRGVYHVLHGCLSPLDGVGPDALKIPELLRRVQKDAVQEIILATNSTIEGEATAVYLTQLLRPFGVAISRIASGMPLGAEVEYIDTRTLALALEDRRAV